MLVGHIGGFAKIVVEVVEHAFLFGAEVFPRSAAGGAINPFIPEEGAFGQGLALEQQRGDVDAVEFYAAGQRGAGECGVGGVEVGQDGGFAGDRRADAARPPGDGRHAVSALAHGALVALELGALRGLFGRPVVGAEEDEGVFGDAELFELNADAADFIIHGGHHLEIGAFDRDLGLLDGVLSAHRRIVGALEGVVGRAEGDVGEERLFVVAFDEIDGVVAD